VVRCWHLANNEHRIDVEHLQSGARIRVATLEAAAAWMDAECGAPVVESSTDAQKR
jgi:hypothetical protein